jgi:hypothetical protein
MPFKFEDVLDFATFRILSESIFTYEEHIARVTELLSVHDELVSCPECLEEAIPFPDPEFEGSRVRCRLCDSEFFAEECRSCGEAMFTDEPITQENDPGRCNDCWQHLFAKAD